MEKIERSELFALLGRGTVGVEPADHTPDELPEADWDPDNLEALVPLEVLTAEASVPVSPWEPLVAPTAAPSPTSASPVTQRAASPKPVITTLNRGGSRADQAKLRRLLEQSVPRLWKYALEKSPTHDPALQRQKLRELLVWLFEKEGYTVTPNAPAPYVQRGKEVKGRVELIVGRRGGGDLLAMETDWTKAPASILKLLTLSKSNKSVVWIVGAPCERTHLHTWRRFADEVCASQSSRWLSILHLEYGWIDD